MSYSDLAQAIIDKEKGVMGQAALKPPKDVGIQVDNDGEIIKMKEDGKKTVGNLIDKYSSYTGDVAIKLAKKAAEDVDTSELELPENLQ